MRIWDDGFNVSMLTLEDFDIAASTQAGLPDVEDNTRTAMICIELAKLCVCIGHVLSSQYTSLETQAEVPPTMMVVPKRPETNIIGLNSCDKEIESWHQGLLSIFKRFDSQPGLHDDIHSCYKVHRAMLNMLHLTLLIVLHRTQGVNHSTDDASAQSTKKSSRAKVKDAARSVTRIAQTMLRLDQIRYAGLPGITALIATCLSHIHDIRSDNEDVRDASVFRFYETMQVLQSLRSIYGSADSAVIFLASVIRKAGISIPEPIPSPYVDSMSSCSESTAATRHYASEVEGPSGREARRHTLAHPEGGTPISSQPMPPLNQHSAPMYLPQPQPHVTSNQQGQPILPGMSTWGFNVADLGNAQFGQLADIPTEGPFVEWTNVLSLDAGIDGSAGMSSDYEFYRGTYDLFA